MATIYKSVKGRKLTDVIARNKGVQDELDRRTFEMAVRAEEDLLEHRMEGHAAIEVAHGDIDWYVVLSDERGQEAAMSIEFGRAGYIDPDTREEYGEMEGLFILARAAHLPKERKNKRRKIRKRRGDLA